MFTVLSNTRNSNLFLIGALAIVVIALLTLAIVPVISAPQPALAPAARLSEAGSDFYQRHPNWTWAVNSQNAAILVTGESAFPDYFQRHPELSVSPILGLGAPDYFQRHPELTTPSILGLEASDYFMRHPELTVPVDVSVDMTDYYFRLSAAQPATNPIDFTDYFFRHP